MYVAFGILTKVFVTLLVGSKYRSEFSVALCGDVAFDRLL